MDCRTQGWEDVLSPIGCFGMGSPVCVLPTLLWWGSLSRSLADLAF